MVGQVAEALVADSVAVLALKDLACNVTRSILKKCKKSYFILSTNHFEAEDNARLGGE